MRKSAPGLVLPFFALYCAMLQLCAAANAQSDIQCGVNKNRYTQPAGCAAQCKANIDASRCMIQPQLKALDDGFFKTFYNSSIFFAGNYLKAQTCGAAKGVDSSIGTNTTLVLPGMVLPGIMPGVALPGPTSRVAVRDKLVERIFGAWLHPNSYADFAVSWTGGGDLDDGWAEVETEKNGAGKYVLKISTLALCRSPAGLVSTIGHEMIHVEQMQRHYSSIGVDDFGAVRSPLREVEAYSWELQQSNFAWKIGRSKWLAGQTSDEIKESKVQAQCYEWQVESGIEKLRTGFGSGGNVLRFGNFLNEDPWTRSVWLPAHSDWKTHKAGPQPAVCKAEFGEGTPGQPAPRRPWDTAPKK